MFYHIWILFESGSFFFLLQNIDLSRTERLYIKLFDNILVVYFKILISTLWNFIVVYNLVF